MVCQWMATESCPWNHWLVTQYIWKDRLESTHWFPKRVLLFYLCVYWSSLCLSNSTIESCFGFCYTDKLPSNTLLRYYSDSKTCWPFSYIWKLMLFKFLLQLIFNVHNSQYSFTFRHSFNRHLIIKEIV